MDARAIHRLLRAMTARYACVLVAALSSGCTATFTLEPDQPPTVQGATSADPLFSKIQPTAATTFGADVESSGAKSDVPFTGRTELVEAELVAQVLARNPTVAQMSAAAQAAAARYPQVTSLDDPKASGTIGPSSIHSGSVDFAYRVEVSQAFPFPGKLSLRGEGALQEAAAATADLDEARLTLAEAARAAFVDYFLAARSAEVNADGLKLLGEFRDNAAARYRNAQGEQQDIFQADVAIARQKERSVALDRMNRVARARINTLMHLSPESPLPPAPKILAAVEPIASVAELRELAVRQRPDIAALRARTSAEEAAIALALKDYYPDFEAMAAYDAFWQRPEKDLRPMVGVRLNLPIRTDRKDAVVSEARARLMQKRAELAKVIDLAGLQVQEAYEQAHETERTLKLYEDSALPAARENVRLAQLSYATGKVAFLNLIEAQRNLVELRDRQFELIAESHRRRAALDRATGTKPQPTQGSAPDVLPTIDLSKKR
jgi:outer membrane protein, heavy metal efflux system